MTNFKKMKAGLLAAVSVTAATVALSPAGASDFDPAVTSPTVAVEAPVIAHAADHGDQEKTPLSPKKWALLAVAASALAGIIKLIGARKVADAVAQGAVKTARVAASTASGAARAVGRTVSSPLRFLAALLGLALFALAGIGLYDVEWIGGLVSGAALTGATLFGMWKTRLALKPVRVKAKPDPVKDNGN
ncbi:hypothetical protein [Hyphococcus sp.]|uniref:hypothetical protein n=1 Tax=Hyphococcus sp. TaxID=2038636 RepID=UPI0035C6C622